MCARYELSSPQNDLLELLELDGDALLAEPVKQLDIHPTDAVCIAINEEPRRLQMASWGFLTPGDLDPRRALRPINARDDKLLGRFWKHAAESQRCLIPASAYFEWKEATPVPGRKGKAKKQPVKFSLKGGKPFCFAGLYSRTQTGLSCTIITTAASSLAAPVHDRMPAILPRDAMAFWIAAGKLDLDALPTLIKPYPPELMIAEEVGPLGPVVASEPPPDPQLDLF